VCVPAVSLGTSRTDAEKNGNNFFAESCWPLSPKRNKQSALVVDHCQVFLNCALIKSGRTALKIFERKCPFSGTWKILENRIGLI